MTAAVKGWTERVCRVDGIVASGCAFYVASGAENFRVNQYGGEREFTQEMIDAVQPGEVFFDIGACIGFVSVHAAAKGAIVHAFEPDPQFRARLKQNISLNKRDKVNVHGWAISENDGAMTLYTDGSHGTSPTLFASEGRGSVEVVVRSIDSAIATGELPPPHVVKLDIEGAEIKALRGMMKLLSAPGKPRKIFIEVHPPFIEQFGDDPAELEAILTSSGYIRTVQRGRYDQLHEIWEVA